MCLITEQKKCEFTEETLTVYKIVELLPWHVLKDVDNIKYVRSLNRYKEYEKDKLYKMIMKADNEFNSCADTDVYFKYKLNEYEQPLSIKLKHLTHVHDGFHFAFDKKRLRDYALYGSKMLAEFEVPKGAEIYKDKTGLGVTNKIIFKRVLKRE